MRTYASFMLCLTLCLLFICRAALGAELSISVRHPDGTPAAGVKVQQVELGPHATSNLLLGVTDEHGEIEVDFEERPGFESQYGYGIYRYVVMPENYGWKVSDLFHWSDDPVYTYRGFMMSQPDSNWSTGKLVEVRPDSQLRWEVTLGRSVEVTVVDQFGEPVRDKRISVSLDLEALTRTGFGAEIPMFDVQTDSEGRFNFPNPSPYFYSFDIKWGGYCNPDTDYFTSVVRGRFEQDRGKIIYHRCIPKSITVIVTDSETGKPIPNADIREEMIFHPGIGRQGGPLGQTDVNGEYRSDSFTTEHVVELSVFKEGYKPHMLDIEEIASGMTYRISLEREGE